MIDVDLKIILTYINIANNIYLQYIMLQQIPSYLLSSCLRFTIIMTCLKDSFFVTFKVSFPCRRILTIITRISDLHVCLLYDFWGFLMLLLQTHIHCMGDLKPSWLLSLWILDYQLLLLHTHICHMEIFFLHVCFLCDVWGNLLCCSRITIFHMDVLLPLCLLSRRRLREPAVVAANLHSTAWVSHIFMFASNMDFKTTSCCCRILTFVAWVSNTSMSAFLYDFKNIWCCCEYSHSLHGYLTSSCLIPMV